MVHANCSNCSKKIHKMLIKYILISGNQAQTIVQRDSWFLRNPPQIYRSSLAWQVPFVRQAHFWVSFPVFVELQNTDCVFIVGTQRSRFLTNTTFNSYHLNTWVILKLSYLACWKNTVRPHYLLCTDLLSTQISIIPTFEWSLITVLYFEKKIK